MSAGQAENELWVETGTAHVAKERGELMMRPRGDGVFSGVRS